MMDASDVLPWVVLAGLWMWSVWKARADLKRKLINAHRALGLADARLLVLETRTGFMYKEIVAHRERVYGMTSEPAETELNLGKHLGDLVKARQDADPNKR